MSPSPTWIELAAALCIGLSGAPGYLWRRTRAGGQGTATALNLIGAAVGFAGLAVHARTGDTGVLLLGTLPIGRLAFAQDGLSALFLIPILLVSALGSLYGASYWREREHRESGRRLRLAWGIMTASMMAVVLARDAIVFLVAWELMAIAGFFLICTEEERLEVRQASWIYLVATHAGTLCLIGCFALLGSAEGSSALWPSLRSEASGWLPTAVFALGIAGFGLKAGLMPLHVWLPGAHANAPSHVSAFLSGVLLKMGIYGVVRVCGLLPHPPLWWGGALLVVGAVSGVLGIALAVAQQDMKRLLAYSSIENIGIIAIGIGLASMGRSLGRADLVVLGLGGALLHVLNHGLFKPLLFLAAGSVLHATGTRRISSLGGLARTMPYTFVLFTFGAVAICGLPPMNGFASELLLYLGLLRVAAVGPVDPQSIWTSLAAPALAIMGALALAAFVKITGIAFGGAPRSPAAAQAHDPDRGMLAPMVALALACLVLGLLPGVATPLLHAAILAWDPALGPTAPPLGELAPLGWVSVAGVSLIAGVALVAVLFARRRPRHASVLTWDCGYVSPTPRMQYVDVSFSELLVGLFDWAVRSRRSPPDLVALFPPRSGFRSEVPDAVLDRIALPLLGAADRGLSRLRVLQRGPVHTYVLYVALAVVSVLLVAR
ncbi:MAG TPA: proton-conducting transporter membrane subunit [Myxococcota bacterium]